MTFFVLIRNTTCTLCGTHPLTYCTYIVISVRSATADNAAQVPNMECTTICGHTPHTHTLTHTLTHTHTHEHTCCYSLSRYWFSESRSPLARFKSIHFFRSTSCRCRRCGHFAHSQLSTCVCMGVSVRVCVCECTRNDDNFRLIKSLCARPPPVWCTLNSISAYIHIL